MPSLYRGTNYRACSIRYDISLKHEGKTDNCLERLKLHMALLQYSPIAGQGRGLVCAAGASNPSHRRHDGKPIRKNAFIDLRCRLQDAHFSQAFAIERQWLAM